MSLKKALGPAEKRELVEYAKAEHGISTRQALKTFSIHPSVFYYKPKPSEDQQVRDKLAESTLHSLGFLDDAQPAKKSEPAVES